MRTGLLLKTILSKRGRSFPAKNVATVLSAKPKDVLARFDGFGAWR